MMLTEFNAACDNSWELPSALSCLIYYQSLSLQLSFQLSHDGVYNELSLVMSRARPDSALEADY